MARQTPGNYVPLDVNYARDVAIRKAGPGAELLYIRALAYAKGSRTGGFVSDYDLDVVGIGLRANKLNAKRLVDVGLWERVSDGWRIRSWERWNASEQIVSAGGKLGNHKRWHLERGQYDPECEHCVASPPIAPRSHPDSPPISPPESQGKGREEETTSLLSSEDAPRPDVQELCELLHRRITEGGSKATITARWRDSARLLLDRDQRPLDEARRLIDWCQDDQFWRQNILSMPKFRDQYDKLRLKAGPRVTHPTGAGRVFDSSKLPPPGEGWTDQQLTMVLGEDTWTCPNPPAGLDDVEGRRWQHHERQRHRAQRVQAACDAIGRPIRAAAVGR
jgi:hypothetical protein